MRKRSVLLILLFAGFGIQYGIAQSIPARAYTNVTLHHANGEVTESAAIVWRDGIIEAVGTKVEIPFDALVTDGGDSLHIYPGFIDGLARWGSPKAPQNRKKAEIPGQPPYEHAGIQPERSPSEVLTEDDSFKKGMQLGFTTAALSPKGEMLPGQVEIFMISPEETDKNLYRDSEGLSGSFEDAPERVYPSTLMGVMARFRQLMYDAEALQDHIRYYKANPEITPPNRDKVLEALFPLVNAEKPLYFSVDSKENIERLFTLQDEFGFDVVLVSGKEAYAKAEELKKRNIPVLVSVDLTDAPSWYKKEKKKKDKEGEREVETEKEEDEEAEPETSMSAEEEDFRQKQLDAWLAHVKNIRSLLDSGVQVGYASDGLKVDDFKEKVAILLEEGQLKETELLQIMTQNTAGILGIDEAFGSLKAGKNASFTLFDKTFTEEKAKAVKSVSNGIIYEVN